MNITYQLVDKKDKEQLQQLLDWSNDPELIHLVNVNFHKEPLKPITMQQVLDSSHVNNEKETYFIQVDQKPVGEVSIEMNPPHLALKGENTAWLGIVIGNPAFRGVGVAKEAMLFAENQARLKGAHRMELGVFAYNQRAIAFYKKLNYKHFYTYKEFTYYKGCFHDDYRMEKWLVPKEPFKTITVIAGVVINDLGQVLICRRMAHKQLGGYWEFPGGKLEEGETAKEALEREIFEELGCQSKTGTHIIDTLYQYDFGRVHLQFYYSQLTNQSNQVLTSTDHDQLEWVNKTHLKDYNFAPADIDIVKLLQKELP